MAPGNSDIGRVSLGGDSKVESDRIEARLAKDGTGR